MKRIVLPLAVVLVLAGAFAYFQRREAPNARQVAALLPGSTILFEDMPNLRRTAERWPDTALAQIISEPEVQTFLERPLGEMPHRAELDKWLSQAEEIDPTHFFLAVTDWTGTGAPQTIAGLSYSGSKTGLDALVDELRSRAQELWPAGKSDIEKYGSGEIETFSTPDFSAALAYRGQWIFIGDTGLLKATLDRFEGTRRDPDSLAELPAFKSSLDRLPGAPDNLLFLRPALLADKATSFALMLNPTADMHGMESLKKIEAVALALKLDGEVMRDAVYILKQQPGEETPLAKDALKLSTADTIVTASERVQGLGGAQLPDPKSDPSGILQLLASYVKDFADQGLGMQQFGQAFGPESGFVLDWPAGAVIPTPVAMVDVRDAAMARKFLDTLATLPIAAGISFSRQEAGGISFYSLPPTGIGLFPLQVTLGLTGKCVIGALNLETVKEGAKRWDAGGAGLEGTAAYRKAAALVEEPTMSFTYVDTKAIFERIYGLFKGVASMGFIPHLSDYVDIAKLPAPQTISRHLSPMVASTAVKDGGLLMESAGPVTMTQAALVVAISAGAAAVPLVEREIKGQSVTTPVVPGPANHNYWWSFTTPLQQGGSANPPAPAASPAPSMAAPSANPSGGTQ